MKTILVVEDDFASRELVREILEAQGYQVIEAGDGQEALQKAEEVDPDLVLMDIRMPILDGFAVLSRLRRDPRFGSLPVLALTAYAMKGDKQRMLAAGFDGYATKPVDVVELSNQIRRCLNTSQP
jgi:CheY-like chemotaxis protein